MSNPPRACSSLISAKAVRITGLRAEQLCMAAGHRSPAILNAGIEFLLSGIQTFLAGFARPRHCRRGGERTQGDQHDPGQYQE